MLTLIQQQISSNPEEYTTGLTLTIQISKSIELQNSRKQCADTSLLNKIVTNNFWFWIFLGQFLMFLCDKRPLIPLSVRVQTKQGLNWVFEFEETETPFNFLCILAILTILIGRITYVGNLRYLAMSGWFFYFINLFFLSAWVGFCA